jgi:hypothetical protein
MAEGFLGTLTATQAAEAAAVPAKAGLAGARDPAGLLRGLQGTADGFAGTARALGLGPVITGLLMAGETWQSTPVDMTGAAHGLSAGFTNYVASVLTDSSTVGLGVEVSQDGTTFGLYEAVVKVAKVGALYIASLDVPWRGFRWMRCVGEVGATPPTAVLSCNAGPRS